MRFYAFRKNVFYQNVSGTIHLSVCFWFRLVSIRSLSKWIKYPKKPFFLTHFSDYTTIYTYVEHMKSFFFCTMFYSIIEHLNQNMKIFSHMDRTIWRITWACMVCFDYSTTHNPQKVWCIWNNFFHNFFAKKLNSFWLTLPSKQSYSTLKSDFFIPANTNQLIFLSITVL